MIASRSLRFGWLGALALAACTQDFGVFEGGGAPGGGSVGGGGAGAGVVGGFGGSGAAGAFGGGGGGTCNIVDCEQKECQIVSCKDGACAWSPAPDGSSCGENQVCAAGTCVPAACSDGVKNGDETDADCGGDVCPGCPVGGECVDAGDCASGNCQQSGPNLECGDCNGGSCDALTYCNPDSGNCEPKLADGESCIGDNDPSCLSGSCVDQVCCNSGCDASCMACTENFTGLANGQCGDIIEGSDPEDECAPGPCRTGDCGGDGCGLVAAGTACGSACVAGFATVSVCDATGSCDAGAGVPCAPYTCNGAATACRTTCTSNANCVDTAFCQLPEGTCVEDRPQGQTCTEDAQCQGNINCEDGYCCDTPCNGAANLCNRPGTEGTCS